jgi:hypothetical protein
MANGTVPEDAKPVPTGSMYIGGCQNRTTGALLRWQYAVVFTGLNAGVAGICIQIFNANSARQCFIVAAISFIMLCINVLFRGLTTRANQWIIFYTERLRDMELTKGTESGVLIFANPNYPGNESEDSRVQGFRFRTGIIKLSEICIFLWGCSLLGCLGQGIFLAGQGLW